MISHEQTPARPLMLAFDDAGLARLVRAASRISYRKRRAWLRDIANRFERAPKLAANARRTGQWRQRQRSGLCLLKIVADEANLAAMLVDVGLLDPLQADNRVALTRATERALARLCDVSLPAGATLAS